MRWRRFRLIALARQVHGAPLLQNKQLAQVEQLLKKSFHQLESIAVSKQRYFDKGNNHLIALYELWDKPQLAEHYRGIQINKP